MQIVLVQPEIPQNTGNIARTCAAVGASLHLIEPLGFSLENRYLKRAGLDYWHLLEVHVHQNFLDYCSLASGFQRYYATKKTGTVYTEVKYSESCALIFGNETRGLPEPLLRRHKGQCVRIPIRVEARSLNLSNAAAILVFEALRQKGFVGLAAEGPGLSR